MTGKELALQSLSEKLQTEALEQVLGPHALIVAQSASRASIGVKEKGVFVCRQITTVEVRKIVKDALGMDIAGWSLTFVRPHPLHSTPQWEAFFQSERHMPADIWLEKGFEICPRCWHVRQEFSLFKLYGTRRVQVAIPSACDQCVDSFRFQTRETVCQWLTDWYRERAREIRNGIFHKPFSPLGTGEHSYQLDAFDQAVAGNHIQRLFGHRCAYCGLSLKVGTKGGIKGQFDHIIAPNGGHNVPENLVLACPSCNSAKADHSGSEYYDIRRRSGLSIPRKLEAIARECEEKYLRCYGALSREMIVQIKRPVVEALMPPTVGGVYYYHPVWRERPSRMLKSGSSVRVLDIVDHRIYYRCRVRDDEFGQEHVVSSASLHKLRQR